MIILFDFCIQNLERRLADVLRQSFKQCPDTAAKLRLLEVFEGTSGRELVQVLYNLYASYYALVHGRFWVDGGVAEVGMRWCQWRVSLIIQ